ncbi:hypothetical protein GCM10010166_21940 [Couchioplanes caeruleus subsp. azureus]|nr:hypothetical protein GCM10010166_21940 [Couchioplanes caeruleus subsp. azureus]
MTGTARQEAERLVAALLARAAQGGRDGLGDLLGSAVGQFLSGTGTQQHRSSTGWATGTAECCVCPICRAMAALRDPTPETAERLATGAGDLATGLATLMRGLSAVLGATRTPDRDSTGHQEPASDRDPARYPPSTPDEAWSAATRTDAQSTTRTGPKTAPTAEPKTAPTAGAKSAKTARTAPTAGGKSATRAAGERVEPPADRNADPWAAATRSPAGTGREAAGGRDHDGSPAEARHDAGARPRARPARKAASPSGRRSAAASGDAAARTEKNAGPERSPADENGESRRESAAAGSGTVDHDVSARPRTPEARETRATGDV